MCFNGIHIHTYVVMYVYIICTYSQIALMLKKYLYTLFPFTIVFQHYDGDMSDLCLTFSLDEEFMGKVSIYHNVIMFLYIHFNLCLKHVFK